MSNATGYENSSESGRQGSGQTVLTDDLSNGSLFDYIMSASKSSAQKQQMIESSHKKTGSLGNSITIHGDVPSGLPKVVRITRLSLHTPIYSFVTKHKSEDELELFTISGYSLEFYTINLNVLETKTKKPEPSNETPSPMRTIGYNRQQASNKHSSTSGSSIGVKQIIDATTKASSLNDSITKTKSPNVDLVNMVRDAPTECVRIEHDERRSDNGKFSVNISHMDRLVEALFTKLNMSFSQGLDEFLSEVRCEVNDLKSKLNELSRDIAMMQLQIHNLKST